MRLRLAATLSPLLVLAGCGQSHDVDAKNKSVAEVAKQVGESGFKFTPGQWDTTIEMQSLDLGRELPPEAAAAMKGMMGKPRTVSACLTPEQAAKPGPEFFGEQQKGCTYDHFTMADGKLDAKLVCQPPQGANGAITMSMAGTFTANGYDLAMSSNGGGPGGTPVAMKMKVSGKRVGECTGKGTN